MNFESPHRWSLFVDVLPLEASHLQQENHCVQKWEQKVRARFACYVIFTSHAACFTSPSGSRWALQVEADVWCWDAGHWVRERIDRVCPELQPRRLSCCLRVNVVVVVSGVLRGRCGRRSLPEGERLFSPLPWTRRLGFCLPELQTFSWSCLFSRTQQNVSSRCRIWISRMISHTSCLATELNDIGRFFSSLSPRVKVSHRDAARAAKLWILCRVLRACCVIMRSHHICGACCRNTKIIHSLKNN